MLRGNKRLFMTKQEYIQSPKKEVEQFHPFLRDRLFAAMQKETAIDSYDYTHGNNEQGADFIVITRDGVTKKEIAVAVIVKSGSITNSLEAVERQISQSKTDKKNQDGEEFSVRRFWVITNNTISKNARDYIKDKFKNLNIEFWDYQEVVRLSDLYMGDDCLNIIRQIPSCRQTAHFVDMMSEFPCPKFREFSLRQTVERRPNTIASAEMTAKEVNVLECAKKENDSA